MSTVSPDAPASVHGAPASATETPTRGWGWTGRLIVSHAAIAAVAGLATYLIVRLLAPRLFDDELGMGAQAGRPGGAGMGAGTGTSGAGMGSGIGNAGSGMGAGPRLREQFASAVDQSLLLGTVVGVVVAALVGVIVALRLVRPLRDVRTATRTIASGRYDVRVDVPNDADLGALATDVNTLAATLADTEQRRMRLLGDVAHELRTPLTTLDGGLEAMIDGVVPASPEMLGAMSGDVRRMRRLADDLSTLSRTSEGRLELQRVPLDLAEVARTAAERLRPQAEDASLSLAVDADTAVTATGDPERLAQVVTNLVGNAIRATPAGGRVTVTAVASPTPRVVVRDTGEGLSDADTERIFERFYRVHGRAGSDGSGVGLTIARQIMEAHGGTLSAASDGEGCGATFTATLP